MIQPSLIPRIGPATDDGAGLGDPFVMTYRFDDDDRDSFARFDAVLTRETTMELAAELLRSQRQSAMNLERDRERVMLGAQLRGQESLWVICPECKGHNPTCHACHGRAWVSPLFAETWQRQGI